MACPLAATNNYDQVSSIIDGDSLVLARHGEIRLIGINTPEYDQPLGLQATRSLRKLIRGKQVLVQFGKESRDRHKRRLVHLQTHNGINPAAVQLQRGYAFHIVVPPNDSLSNCYAKLEEQARSARLNIWKHPAYQPRKATTRGLRKGFQRIEGQVSSLKFKTAGVEIAVVDSHIRLFIPQDHLASFGGRGTLKNWLGADFIVRGWLTPRKNYLSLRLEHPNMVEYLINEGTRLL